MIINHLSIINALKMIFYLEIRTGLTTGLLKIDAAMKRLLC